MPKIQTPNTTLKTKIESDAFSKDSAEPKTFSLPNMANWLQRWINLALDQHAQLIARCHSRSYHSDNISEWDAAVKYQLETGDNSRTIECIRKRIASIEKALKRNVPKNFTTFNEYFETETQRLILEQRYKSDEGHCAHDSLYNALMDGFSGAVFLVRDAKGPRYLHGFMAEKKDDTSDKFDPELELNKPLNRRIFGKGLYHDGLQPDPPLITGPGSGWHNLLQDIVDSNHPLGIVPGYGDNDEFVTCSPRAVLLVQGHSSNLDTRTLEGIKRHAMYTAQRIMPRSPDYLPIPKP